MLRRRHLLALPATLGLARAADRRVLRFVPESNLATIDPVWNITPVTRNHGMMVWDMLYGRDAGFVPRPQMAAGHEVSDDGRRWRFGLREGLRFHDGTPVLAVDCIASIRRWATRRPLGQRLTALADAMTVLDDRQFEIRLRAPFPQMTLALSEFCFVMPERIARTDPGTRIAEVTGSGPFRFLADEWESGARAAYARFDGYVPRQEPPSFMAGGKVAMFDRVAWQVIPDPATAAAALAKGEVDWVQQPQADILPLLRNAAGVRVLSNDRVGVMGLLALNHLHPPFDSLAVRQAVLASVSQRDFMEAAVGDPAMYQVPIGVFTPGLGMASDAGPALPGDLARGKAMLRASGYKGEAALVMGAADSPVTQAMAQVAADLFRQIGLNVQYASMDLGTLVQRRASKAPPDQGGWSAFTTTYEGLTMADPATNVALRGNGAGAWFGWPDSPRLEALRDQWLDSADPDRQRVIAAQIQAVALEEVPFVPLGQVFYPTAVRSDIGSLIESPFPVFWHVRRG